MRVNEALILGLGDDWGQKGGQRGTRGRYKLTRLTSERYTILDRAERVQELTLALQSDTKDELTDATCERRPRTDQDLDAGEVTERVDSY